MQTFIYSFKTKVGFPAERWVGLENYRDLLAELAFRDTLFNTLLWILFVPVATVILGLIVATLADRLKTRGENTVKTLIFMPMAISMVGAATVWALIYDYRPEGQPADRHAERHRHRPRRRPDRRGCSRATSTSTASC